MLVFFPTLVLISLERTESKQVENQSLIFIVGKGSAGVHAWSVSAGRCVS